MRNIGNWRKGDPWYKTTKNSSELYCIIVKGRISSYETEYLAEEIFQQTIKAAALSLIVAYGEI